MAVTEGISFPVWAQPARGCRSRVSHFATPRLTRSPPQSPLIVFHAEALPLFEPTTATLIRRVIQKRRTLAACPRKECRYGESTSI